MFSVLYLRVKAEQYFVNLTYMLLGGVYMRDTPGARELF